MKGFTLIEIVIVTALIAIVSTLSVQSYQSHILRSEHLVAQNNLQALALAVESYRLQFGSYSGVDAPEIKQAVMAQAGLFEHADEKTAEPYEYNISKVSHAGLAYELVAFPRRHEFSLGALRLSSNGLKYWDRDQDNQFGPDENCWSCN